MDILYYIFRNLRRGMIEKISLINRYCGTCPYVQFRLNADMQINGGFYTVGGHGDALPLAQFS